MFTHTNTKSDSRFEKQRQPHKRSSRRSIEIYGWPVYNIFILPLGDIRNMIGWNGGQAMRMRDAHGNDMNTRSNDGGGWCAVGIGGGVFIRMLKLEIVRKRIIYIIESNIINMKNERTLAERVNSTSGTERCVWRSRNGVTF